MFLFGNIIPYSVQLYHHIIIGTYNIIQYNIRTPRRPPVMITI